MSPVIFHIGYKLNFLRGMLCIKTTPTHPESPTYAPETRLHMFVTPAYFGASSGTSGGLQPLKLLYPETSPAAVTVLEGEELKVQCIFGGQ